MERFFSSVFFVELLVEIRVDGYVGRQYNSKGSDTNMSHQMTLVGVPDPCIPGLCCISVNSTFHSEFNEPTSV